MITYDDALLCECGEHRVSDTTCRRCGERLAVYGGRWCCVCRTSIRRENNRKLEEASDAS